jgi:hypothetical protein
MTTDAADINLNPNIRECWVCGEDAPPQLGIPVLHEVILHNGWQGQWNAVAACRRCFDRQQTLTKPMRRRDFMDMGPATVLISINREFDASGLEKVDVATYRTAPFIFVNQLIQLRDLAGVGTPTIRFLTTNCENPSPEDFKGYQLLTTIRNLPWLNEPSTFHIIGAANVNTVVSSPLKFIKFYVAIGKQDYNFIIYVEEKKKSISQRLRELADELEAQTE